MSFNFGEKLPNFYCIAKGAYDEVSRDLKIRRVEINMLLSLLHLNSFFNLSIPSVHCNEGLWLVKSTSIVTVPF